jgi:hypothetical protein
VLEANSQALILRMNAFGAVYFQDEIPIKIDPTSCVVFDHVRMLSGIDKANASAVLTQSVHLQICAANRTIAVIYDLNVGQGARSLSLQLVSILRLTINRLLHG